MPKNLALLASKLSLADIKALAKLKKGGGRLKTLKNKEKKLARQLAAVRKKIAAAITGKDTKKVKVATGTPKAVAKKAVAKGPKQATVGITDAIRKVMAGGKAMKAADIAKALPGVDFPVTNEAVLKQKIAVNLGTQKKVFKKVAKGTYKLIPQKATETAPAK